MKLLRWAALSVCAVLASATSALAADYNAEVTFQFFNATCLRRLAVPDDIRAWAKDTRLPQITEPNAVNTFVGTTPGAKGIAWMLPSPNDWKFTLSLRAGTQTCAIWAESGDPATAEALFRKMITESARPGTKVSVDEDQSFPTATGKSRLLTMSVTEEATGGGYEFTFMAGDHTGTFFSGAPVQLSMQLARSEGKSKSLSNKK